MKTTQLRIDSTDVILNDFDLGQGKLIISNDGYGYNFAYYWGAMGNASTLKDFLLHINSDYFVEKLGPIEHGTIDMVATMKGVREWWKNESGISWYQEMDLQKDIRREFNFIQNTCYDDRHFVELMGKIKDSFYFPNTVYKTDFEEALDSLCSEPWNFIINAPHKQNVWLEKFFNKLQSKLKDINL